MATKQTKNLVYSICFLLSTLSGWSKGTPAIKVNDVTITTESIDSVVELLTQQQFKGRALTSDEHTKLVQMVASNFLSQELFLNEAKLKKIKVPNQQVDSMMGVFKSSFPSTADYQSALAKVGDSEASIKVKMERQLVLEKMVTSVVQVLERPTEQEMKTYFTANKEKFPVNNSLRASQILLKVPAKAPVTKQEEIRKTLEKYRDVLVSETHLDIIIEKFTRLAMAKSEDPQAESGGDLGSFKLGEFMPEFDKQIQKLSVGNVSEVFKTSLGYHLILLTEKNDGTYENSRLKIMQIYVLEKTKLNQEKMETHLQALLKKNQVKFFNDKYKGDLTTNFSPRAAK